MDNKKAKKKAHKVKPEERETKAFEYLNKAAKKKKEAAEQIGIAMEDVNKSFKAAIENAGDKDKQTVIKVVQDVNKLLSEARNGGDINKIIEKLNALK
jgi:uncharacterized protein with von Willebrand factor type A (vWA) domain